MFEETQKQGLLVRHYYGDTVRRFFVVGGALMIATLPFVRDFLPTSIFAALVAILVVGFFAGLANPRQRWVAGLNLLIAIAAFLIFEYVAVSRYFAGDNAPPLWFIILNQVLALDFFAALYYASKTLRGMTVGREGELLRGGK